VLQIDYCKRLQEEEEEKQEKQVEQTAQKAPVTSNTICDSGVSVGSAGTKRTAGEAGFSAQDQEVEETRAWKVARLREALQGAGWTCRAWALLGEEGLADAAIRFESQRWLTYRRPGQLVAFGMLGCSVLAFTSNFCVSRPPSL
jgi:hypothetical protein